MGDQQQLVRGDTTLAGMKVGNVPWVNTKTWLTSLGLESLESKFIEHEVTWKEIGFLTEKHLIDMGVTNVGDRLRIIESTRAFLRGERNRTRNRDTFMFQGRTWFPCFKGLAPVVHVSPA